MTTHFNDYSATSSAGWVERHAKLFEAGEFPDKGVSVSEDDLAALENGFSGAVPVLIEHAESPLELGFLTAVKKAGRELLGTLRLSREADALVQQSGARSLSLGLSADLRTIREVSLVRHPRVADARLFSHGIVEFSGELKESPARLEGRGGLDRLVREGRLVPAQVPFVEAMLGCESTIDFSGDRRSVRELLLAMIERQPPLGLFSQTAPAVAVHEGEGAMTPEETAFYRRHFPGVPLTAIAEAKQG